jgi:hypothetical protein
MSYLYVLLVHMKNQMMHTNVQTYSPTHNNEIMFIIQHNNM